MVTTNELFVKLQVIAGELGLSMTVAGRRKINKRIVELTEKLEKKGINLEKTNISIHLPEIIPFYNPIFSGYLIKDNGYSEDEVIKLLQEYQRREGKKAPELFSNSLKLEIKPLVVKEVDGELEISLPPAPQDSKYWIAL